MVGALLACWAGSARASDAIKIAVMDQQAVLERSKAGKAALEEMTAYQAKRSGLEQHGPRNVHVGVVLLDIEEEAIERRQSFIGHYANPYSTYNTGSGL